MTRMMTEQRFMLPKYETGGALVESLLLSGVLVIFMIGIPMLGSLVDLKQKTIQASRYAAWEKTVQPNNAPITDQIDARFFMDESAPIRTARPSEEQLGTNMLWGEMVSNAPQNHAPDDGSRPANEGSQPASRDNLQLYQRARVTADVANIHMIVGEDGVGQTGLTPSTPMPAVSEGLVYRPVGRVVGELGRFISKDGWNDGNPYVNGLMRSQIEVKVENNEILKYAGGTCLQGGAGCINESTSILVDGWSAADAKTIRDRVHGFVPSSRLQKVGELISKVKVVPMLNDLEHLEGAFGCTKLGVRPSKDMRELPSYQPMEGDNC